MRTRRIFTTLFSIMLTVTLMFTVTYALVNQRANSTLLSNDNNNSMSNSAQMSTNRVGIRAGEVKADYSTDVVDGVAISTGIELKQFIKNEAPYTDKSGYLTAPIEYNWDEEGAPYMAPSTAVLGAGRTLDGCGFTITFSGLSVESELDDKVETDFFKNKGTTLDEEKFDPGTYEGTYKYENHGGLFTVVQGTVKNVNYVLNSSHKYKTGVDKGKRLITNLGGMAGYVTSTGTINNVSMNINTGIKFGGFFHDSGSDWNMETLINVGGVVGLTSGTVENIAVNMSSNSEVVAYTRGNRGGPIYKYDYVNGNAWAGGVVGRGRTGKMNNIKWTRTDNTSKINVNRYTNSATCRTYGGGIVGRLDTGMVLTNSMVGNTDGYLAGSVNGSGTILGQSNGTLSNYYRINYEGDNVWQNSGNQSVINLMGGEGFDAVFDKEAKDGLVVMTNNDNSIFWGYTGNSSLFYQGSNVAKISTPTNYEDDKANGNRVNFNYGSIIIANDFNINFDLGADNGVYNGQPYVGYLYSGAEKVSGKYELKYGANTKNVGDVTAQLAAIDKILYYNETDKTVVLSNNNEIKATMTITQREITVSTNNYNSLISNVYSGSSIYINGLVSNDNVKVNGKEVVATQEIPYQLTSVGEYIVSVPNGNYKLAEDTTTRYMIKKKYVELGKDILINGNLPEGVELSNNGLEFSKKVDGVPITATSTVYGIIYNGVTGGTSVSGGITTSGVYEAVVGIGAGTTRLELTKTTASANVSVSSNTSGGTVEVNKTTVVIGGTATFTAVPEAGYAFMGWIDDQGYYVSTNTTYTVKVGANGVSLKASFYEIADANAVKQVILKNRYNKEIAKYTVANTESNVRILFYATNSYQLEDEAYNSFGGWAIDNANSTAKVVVLIPTYNESTLEITVKRDGVDVSYAINSKIQLTAGRYYINGIETVVEKTLNVYAIDGLVINTTDESGVARISGSYDQEKECIRMNIAHTEEITTGLKLVYTLANGMSYESDINPTFMTNYIAQTFIMLPSNFIAEGNFTVKVCYRGTGEQIGNIMVFNKEAK